MTSEKSFQAYFMKQVPHGYRTSLTTGGGFPDVLLIHADQHSLVELKILPIGPSGDRKLKSLFKKTQPPWYLNYLHKGGTQLYILFKLEKKYGLLHVDPLFVRVIDEVRYSNLPEYDYMEYDNLKELISDHFV